MALRATVPRAALQHPARGASVVARSHKNVAMAVAAAAVVLSSAPVFAFAEGTPSEPSQPPAPLPAVTSISFTRVDMKVTEKLRERDTNMEWKCKGLSMYDCSGELAEAKEQQFEEMTKMFKEINGGKE